jgi:toxin YhaV
VNGWTIFFHPLFLGQMERLVSAASIEAAKREPGEPHGPNTKLVWAIRQIVVREVPEDPSRPRYRHGGTLDEELKHWFRAKFGNGRFRLFFRYHSASRVIVFAWVNDSETLRTYGSRTDAYVVFRGMLAGRQPSGRVGSAGPRILEP